jgi:hypothetical protein
MLYDIETGIINYTELIQEDAIRDLLVYMDRGAVAVGDINAEDGIKQSVSLAKLIQRVRVSLEGEA